MKKSHSLGASLSSSETLAGFVFLAVQLLVLPTLLYWVNAQAGNPMNDAEINFLFYIINFIVTLVIFHDFLGNSGRQAFQHPAQLCQAVILGLAAYYACLLCTANLIHLIAPGYANYNDEAIYAMERGNTFLIAIATVILVPPVEECLYRGLIFRNLYGKNKVLAYLLSIAVFAVIHILGYLDLYAPLELLLAFLQYLPAGLCLAWSYAKADTIFAPILMHAAINYITLNGWR
ncbi:MAG: lysostaphin resistance A-like protein [Faecousia sp.]